MLGCRTCKRSYHAACLGDSTTGHPTSAGVFYCPVCIERGWNVQPPSEILPLTPVSSRETSPAPASPRNVPAVETRPQMDRMESGWTGGPELHHFPALTSPKAAVQRAFVAVNHPKAAAAAPQLHGRETPIAGTGTPGSGAAAFMRTYDLQPPLATSSGRQAGSIEHLKPVSTARLGRPKSSRYQSEYSRKPIPGQTEPCNSFVPIHVFETNDVSNARRSRPSAHGHISGARGSHSTPAGSCRAKGPSEDR